MKELVTFSPPIAGRVLPPWHPDRNVVALTYGEPDNRNFQSILIQASNHPEYLVGGSYRLCRARFELAYEEDGKYYRDASDAEVQL